MTLRQMTRTLLAKWHLTIPGVLLSLTMAAVVFNLVPPLYESDGVAVLVQSGAVLDLAAHPAGGGAGSLAISSDGNQVVLDGTIRAQAAAGQRGASFALDIASLSNFASLNQRLGEAGFLRSREFRIRTGDVTVDGTTAAESFLLAADQGRVTVAGIVDADVIAAHQEGGRPVSRRSSSAAGRIGEIAPISRATTASFRSRRY